MENPIHIHRFSRTWLAATIFIVLLAIAVSGFFINKSSHLKSSKKPVSSNSASTKATTSSPVSPDTKTQTQQTAAELKSIDLASLKSSIDQVKSLVKAFSQ